MAAGFRLVSEESVETYRSMSASTRVALPGSLSRVPMRGMERSGGRKVIKATLVKVLLVNT